MAKNNTPLEYDEQCAFVEWLEYKGLKFTAVPNSTYTKSWNQKRLNKKSGLRSGFPDMIVLTPQGMLCVELKRVRGGRTSPEQKEWAEALQNTPGVEARIVKGCEEAIKFVEEFL
jgi:hypothetical protein